MEKTGKLHTYNNTCYLFEGLHGWDYQRLGLDFLNGDGRYRTKSEALRWAYELGYTHYLMGDEDNKPIIIPKRLRGWY